MLMADQGIDEEVLVEYNKRSRERQEAYREFYAGQPFTKVVDKTPTTKLATHSNMCLINVSAQGSKAIVTSALDNLIKGASGQAVQNMNVMCGFEETAGLL